MPINVQQVISYVKDANQSSDRLILLVGQPSSGKSKLLRELSVLPDWRYIDCRSLVTEELLETLPNLRPRTAPEVMNKILTEYQENIYLLDRIQVLFAPLLKLDPLELLKQLSQDRFLVVAWPGRYQDGKLYFSYNGIKEKAYDKSGFQVISLS